MGFKPQITIYNLSFEGTSLDGLHVRASCCTVKEYNRMIAAVGGPIPDLDDADAMSERAELLSQENEWILQLFADHLVSWDLEHPITGEPVPATREGFDDLERTLISMLINAWQKAIVSIPNPSKKPSANGGISAEASLGLGDVSQNPPS